MMIRQAVVICAESGMIKQVIERIEGRCVESLYQEAGCAHSPPTDIDKASRLDRVRP
jgi:hypothetical protein